MVNIYRYYKNITSEQPAHIASPPNTVQTPCQPSANLLTSVDLGFSQGILNWISKPYLLRGVWGRAASEIFFKYVAFKTESGQLK